MVWLIFKQIYNIVFIPAMPHKICDWNIHATCNARNQSWHSDNSIVLATITMPETLHIILGSSQRLNQLLEPLFFILQIIFVDASRPQGLAVFIEKGDFEDTIFSWAAYIEYAKVMLTDKGLFYAIGV